MSARRERRMLWIAAIAGALAIGLGVILAVWRPWPPAGPRPLTVEESERLAVTRFLPFRAGGFLFDTELHVGPDAVDVRGSMDLRAGVGTAVLDAGSEHAVMQWNDRSLVVWLGAGDGATIPSAPPEGAGSVRALGAAVSEVDVVLLMVGRLGSDRPDNAQLLRQSDARRLRADEVGGVPVDVFAGPGDPANPATSGNTRFWIDADGMLRRYEADLGSGTVVVDVTTDGFRAVPASPQLPD